MAVVGHFYFVWFTHTFTLSVVSGSSNPQLKKLSTGLSTYRSKPMKKSKKISYPRGCYIVSNLITVAESSSRDPTRRPRVTRPSYPQACACRSGCEPRKCFLAHDPCTRGQVRRLGTQRAPSWLGNPQRNSA